MIEKERQRKLNAALRHLNKAAYLLGKVTVKEPFEYSCPIIGIFYDTDCPDEIEVQLGTDIPEEFAAKAKLDKRSDMFDKLVLKKGNLKLFDVVDKEGSNEE